MNSTRIEYAAALKRAFEKSRSWGLIPSESELAFEAATSTSDVLPHAAAWLDWLQEAGGYSLDLIRQNCAGVHLHLAKLLRSENIPALLTIGDVIVDGKPEYGTSYQSLKREARGVNHDDQL